VYNIIGHAGGRVKCDVTTPADLAQLGTYICVSCIVNPSLPVRHVICIIVRRIIMCVSYSLGLVSYRRDRLPVSGHEAHGKVPPHSSQYVCTAVPLPCPSLMPLRFSIHVQYTALSGTTVQFYVTISPTYLPGCTIYMCPVNSTPYHSD
jgi:hypothetical protein